MRIARDLGDLSLILPAGCQRITDAPFTFTGALKAALRFLSFEEMMPDDIPPRRIWMDGKAMQAHFRELKLRHQSDRRANEIDEPVQNELLSMYVK